MAKMASRLHASFEVRLAGCEHVCSGIGALGGGHSVARLCAWLVGLLPGSKRVVPAAGVRGASTAAGGSMSVPTSPPRLLVVYSFRYGVRRLTVTDRLRIQGCAIASMRRSFKL